MFELQNHILELVQENLFLKPEQRDQIREWSTDSEFLAKNGQKLIATLKIANEQETALFKAILKDDPEFFRNIKRESLRGKLKEKLSQESALRVQESENLDKFLENEFASLES